MIAHLHSQFAADEMHAGFNFWIGSEGIHWIVGLCIWAFLILWVIWTFHTYAHSVRPSVRFVLMFLRGWLFFFIILLLVRPILFIKVEAQGRSRLLVLLDMTRSMTIVDERSSPEDLARAALAVGKINSLEGFNQKTDQGNRHELLLSRGQILESIAQNSNLTLWPRLSENSDLICYGFGLGLTELGPLNTTQDKPPSLDRCRAFFHSIAYDQEGTALGDSLEELLQKEDGNAISGILLITDGANNSGSSPTEAASVAKKHGVPLFVYGIGITNPKGIFLSDLECPLTSNVNEKLTVGAHIKTNGFAGKEASVQLKVNGVVVDERPFEIASDGDQDIHLSYIPKKIGRLNLEAFIPPLADEIANDNNRANASVTIGDNRLKVLYIEDEPRWDFQYLLQMLERDRRLQVSCVLLRGDSDLSKQANSRFLDKVPDRRSDLFDYDLIILGDVNPLELGSDRMKLMEEWVSSFGGGIIFQSGPKFDPSSFRGTPLEPVIPVESSGKAANIYPDGVHLQLTPDGAASQLLRLDDDGQKNLRLWSGFQGVRWTDRVDNARPGAQVLLVDPAASRGNSRGLMPVMASQFYGSGQSLFIGMHETYRWRSIVGEKYYTQIWGQIIQAVTAQHSSALTQLKLDRNQYRAGDKVQISAKILKSDFEPANDSQVEAILSINSSDPAEAHPSHIFMDADNSQPGLYRTTFIAHNPGEYTFHIKGDVKTVVNFDVGHPIMEMAAPAMNESLLKTMALATGGKFLREENLNELPDLIKKAPVLSSVVKEVPFSFSPLILTTVIILWGGEWLLRKSVGLK